MGLRQRREARLQRVTVHLVGAYKSIMLRLRWRWVLQDKQYVEDDIEKSILSRLAKAQKWEHGL